MRFFALAQLSSQATTKCGEKHSDTCSPPSRSSLIGIIEPEAQAAFDPVTPLANRDWPVWAKGTSLSYAARGNSNGGARYRVPIKTKEATA